MTMQTAFTAAIFDPDLPTPPGLSDPEGRPAGKRFDVYRNNVTISLIKATEDTFPVLVKLIGAGNFRTLATLYARAHPPSTALMMFYGAKMPDFLEGFEPLKQYGYLPDVARLELAMRRSYHAADTTAIDGAALGALPTDALMEATLTLSPATRLIRSPWPLFAIWRANTETDAPAPVMQPEDVLVTRAEYDPEPQLLPPGAGAFIAALQDGATFGAAIEAATDAAPDFDLSATLGLLLAGSAIIALNERKTP